MNIEDKLKALCVQHGLWPQEAEAIVKDVETRLDDDMRHRWRHEVTEYPPQMIAVLWMNTRRAALAYIDERKPQHFARLIFAFDDQHKNQGPQEEEDRGEPT